MKIVSLTEEHEDNYFVCLEDWSDEIKEAGDHKQLWFQKMKDKGLGVKLALNEESKPVGMIQYIPIEHSYVEGKNLYFILCIWVHGYKNKGVGNYQKKGIGKALIKAAEEEEIFVNDGRDSEKPFSDDAVPPRWIIAKKKQELDPNKVTVTGFINGWCPAYNMIHERAKRASLELGDRIVFQEINTFDKEVFNEWGISDALLINRKKVNTGPPPSYKKIKKKISKALNKIN